jgi:hypothetical protein
MKGGVEIGYETLGDEDGEFHRLHVRTGVVVYAGEYVDLDQSARVELDNWISYRADRTVNLNGEVKVWIVRKEIATSFTE